MRAGTAVVDISPDKSMFLWGYPHVERMSTGVNDPLYATVLFMDNGSNAVMTIALDLLYISAKDTSEIRKHISEKSNVTPENIMISCSHTHSGPVTVEMIISGSDPVVPAVDQEYMSRIKEEIVAAGLSAIDNVVEAEVAVTTAHIDGVGCNRNDPDGLRDPEAGIIVVRNSESGGIFSVSLVYCMHPTVLHEDSTLISSDFPGYAREYIQKELSSDIVVNYHTGPQGNQSPRYHVKAQTFEEAERLGNILGASVVEAVNKLESNDFCDSLVLNAATEFVDSVRKLPMSLEEADKNLRFWQNEFERLKIENAGHGPIRTAECSVFGAEEAVFIAKCAADGSLDEALENYQKLEVQVIRIGDCCIVALAGELFVEYSLAIKEQADEQVFVLCCTNGETQGYIVTEGATGYEADNALFAPETGVAMVNKALELIERI